jgi:hypothetical protein
MFDRASFTERITIGIGVVRRYIGAREPDADLLAAPGPGAIHVSFPFGNPDGKQSRLHDLFWHGFLLKEY